MGDGELSDDLRMRLEALRSRGCQVDGPTLAEDTSSTGRPAMDEHRDRLWHVALRCAAADGRTISAEGGGRNADDAARAALAELERAAPAVTD